MQENNSDATEVHPALRAAMGKKRIARLILARPFVINEDCSSSGLYQLANRLLARYNCALMVYQECIDDRISPTDFLDSLYLEMVREFNTVAGEYFSSSSLPMAAKPKKGELEKLLRSSMTLLERIDEYATCFTARFKKVS